MTATITSASCHLTAADRRNIKAVMASPGFTYGQTYKVNGRKTYALADLGDGQAKVTIGSWEQDWTCRRWVERSQTFTVA